MMDRHWDIAIVNASCYNEEVLGSCVRVLGWPSACRRLWVCVKEGDS